MKYLYILLITAVTQSLFAQVNIQVKVKQTHSKQAKLYRYQKADLKLVDSVQQVSPEVFRLILPAGYPQGLYKLALGKNIGFDFIVAAEPQITLETIVFAAEDSLKSIVSKENEVFIKYQKVKKRYKQQLWHLNSLIDYYPDSSAFNQALSAETIRVNAKLYWASKNLAEENPLLYISSLIKLELKPISLNGISRKDKNTLISNWWAEVNLYDKRLINSPSLDPKLWEFIELFFDDNLDKEQQDSSFISAANRMISLNADTAIKDNFRSFFLSNFLETDYDATIRYVYKTPFAGLQPMKLTPEEQSAYSELSVIGIGTKVFDFKATASDGNSIRLSKVEAPYKLVVFWSMFCPHCTEMMPELLKIYNQYKGNGFEIIAISIDDDIAAWRNYISERKFSWINLLVAESSRSKILPEYSVDGTPLLFLIDHQLTIISCPSNVKQLEAKLKRILE